MRGEVSSPPRRARNHQHPHISPPTAIRVANHNCSDRFVTFTLARLVSSWVTVPGNCTISSPTVPHSPCCRAFSKFGIDLDWHRYLLEHGLLPDGRPNPDAKELQDGGSCETFFTETGSGKYVPRSIFVDLDPSVCGSIRVAMVNYLCEYSQSMRSEPDSIANCSILNF